MKYLSSNQQLSLFLQIIYHPINNSHDFVKVMKDDGNGNTRRCGGFVPVEDFRHLPPSGCESSHSFGVAIVEH